MKITLLTGKTFDIAQEAGYPLKVVRSSRCRRLSLRIDAKLRMPVLNVPLFCTARNAATFARRNREWVEGHLAKLGNSRKFCAGDVIRIFGEKAEICHCPAMQSGVILQDGKLMVSGGAEFLARRVKDFIFDEAQRRLLRLSREKAACIGCKVNRVTVKDTKSRWGSCSSLNNINYNWRIALAPLPVIDYLVAHEVAHLRHRNHGADFWNCVAALCPTAENGRQWLKNNSRSLYVYE